MATGPLRRTLAIIVVDELAGVRAVVPKLLEYVHCVDEILTVDGNSTDGTREFLEAQGIRVIIQDRPGRGEAIRMAVSQSSGDHILFFSPDGNEDPEDVPRLFDVLGKGADMVIASRFSPGARNEEDGAMLPLRKWVNRAFTFLSNILWNDGPYVTDTINGFRAVTRDAFLRLAPRSMGYSVEYEMTIRAMKYQMRTVEIPTIEGPRIGGKTKAPSLRTGLVFLQLFFRELFRKAE